MIAPIGVRPPYSVTVLSGFEISASWYPPKSTAGLLSHYILRAYNMDRLELPPIETILTDTSIYNGDTIVSFFRIAIIVIYLQFCDNMINLLCSKTYVKSTFR